MYASFVFYFAAITLILVKFGFVAAFSGGAILVVALVWLYAIVNDARNTCKHNKSSRSSRVPAYFRRLGDE